MSMKWTHLCLSVMSLAITAATVVAQAPGRPGPPPPTNPYLSYFVAILGTAAVCAGAWKSSKRSHQD